MNLPDKLKHFNLFVNGTNYLGRTEEIEPPKFTRKMEDYQGAGMIAPIKTDHGLELMEMTVTMGGMTAELLNQFGVCEHDGVRLRLAGSFAPDDSCDAKALEMTIGGRFEEIELPQMKSGENSQSKFKVALSYIKLSYDGKEICEIDIMNMIERWGGTDRMADHRKNIGA